MRKDTRKSKRRIFEVQEEVKIGNVILEKGDKFRVIPNLKEAGYDEVEILVSDRSGVYIPQEFAESYESSIINFREIDKDDWQTILNGPDEEWYWDAWNNIMDTAILKLRGKKYNLYQDGDLFAIPVTWGEKEFEAWAGY